MAPSEPDVGRVIRFISLQHKPRPRNHHVTSPLLEDGTWPGILGREGAEAGGHPGMRQSR